ncbi:DIS3-like exonuclease 1 [Lampetra fluviatilis]
MLEPAPPQYRDPQEATTRTEKILHLRSQRGHGVRVRRELYLRQDVACSSALCVAQCDRGSKLLGANLTHYLVPGCTVVQEFLEILELPELQGVVFTQTSCNALQHAKGRRHYNRLRSLLKDMRRECVMFANEFQRFAYCAREPGETPEAWKTRSVYQAAVWYYDHLVGQIPIVMLTEDPEDVRRYGAATPGVFVMLFLDYLQNFWPDVQMAHELYASIHQMLQESKSQGLSSKREFPEHLSQEVLEAGIKSSRYIKGILSVNKHRAQLEAFVRCQVSDSKQAELQSDVLVPGVKARNRAVHGDTVVVELLPRAEWHGRATGLSGGDGTDERAEEEAAPKTEPMPTGRVVGILQRNWRDYVATFPSVDDLVGQSAKSQKVLVVPWDFRVPKIRISTNQSQALQDYRVVVRIDSWEATSQYPNGHFVRVLGRAGELETEVAALLVENAISVLPFSEAQLREMPVDSPETPWQMDSEEVARRRDLRSSHLIFSVDPPGCEDVDDALSVKTIAGGNLELGVHIADVTHFLRPHSHTDLEARARATTYYLADRRFDMLPSVLSGNLCSLLGGVDRYAVSVRWELDGDTYEVKRVWYGRTVIRSAYKLSYETAQALLDGGAAAQGVTIPELAAFDDGTRQERLRELVWALGRLTDVARAMRARRTEEGGLELESVEVRVQMSESRDSIADLVPQQPLEVHETVAECMIAANHWVARRVAQALPGRALLRHHPPPRHEFFEELKACAAALGFHIDTSSNKALAGSLDNAVDPNDPLINKMLRTMAVHAMSNALYFSTGSLPVDQHYHYGLALDHYTHFTSPIRRYADVMVHRQLLAVLEAKGAPETTLLNTELQELCEHINERNRAAQQAQKESIELFQCLFFRDKDPEQDDRCVEDGIVYSLRADGVLIHVPRYGLKGAAYLKNKDGLVVSVGTDDVCEFVPGCITRGKNHITTQPSVGRSLTVRLFDHLTVRISVQPRRAHADTIRLEVTRMEQHRPRDKMSEAASASTNAAVAEGQQDSSMPRNARADMVREVRQRAEEGSKVVTPKSGRSPLWEPEFSQSKGCLYDILEDIRELALMDATTA